MNLHAGLVSLGGVSNRGFKQKGPSCPIAVPVAWLYPLRFLFFRTSNGRGTALEEGTLQTLCNIIF